MYGIALAWKAANTGDKASFDEYAAKELEVRRACRYRRYLSCSSFAHGNLLEPVTARALEVIELVQGKSAPGRHAETGQFVGNRNDLQDPPCRNRWKNTRTTSFWTSWAPRRTPRSASGLGGPLSRSARSPDRVATWPARATRRQNCWVTPLGKCACAAGTRPDMVVKRLKT